MEKDPPKIKDFVIFELRALKTIFWIFSDIFHHVSSLVSALSDYAGLVTHNRIFSYCRCAGLLLVGMLTSCEDWIEFAFRSYK